MANKKPTNPYPEFPHANGLWVKTIKGKLHDFGRWDDPKAAVAKYPDQRDDLQAGRMPRSTPADTRRVMIRWSDDPGFVQSVPDIAENPGGQCRAVAADGQRVLRQPLRSRP